MSCVVGQWRSSKGRPYVANEAQKEKLFVVHLVNPQNLSSWCEQDVFWLPFSGRTDIFRSHHVISPSKKFSLN